MRLIFFVILPVIFSSCGTSYHYYSPPVFPPSFGNQNEFHLSGNAGITGSAASAGYAINDAIALTGTYHLSSPLNYRGNESELGLSIAARDSTYSTARVSLGCGIGKNYEYAPGGTLKNFRGDFIKPFMMLSFGSANKECRIGDFIYADGAFSLKLNYLIYDGYKATTQSNMPSEKKFNTAVFFTEPYFNFNLGFKWFRISFGVGAALKKKYAFDKNLAIYPAEANVGMLFILGRNGPREIPGP